MADENKIVDGAQSSNIENKIDSKVKVAKTTNTKVKSVGVKIPKASKRDVVTKKEVKTKKKVAAKIIKPKKTKVKKANSSTKIPLKSSEKKINPNQYFYLNNGEVIKSITQLAQMMDEISDELFFHHVNEDKHDFANWITNVFEEEKLGKELMDAEKQKEKNHYIVLKYVVKGK